MCIYIYISLFYTKYIKIIRTCCKSLNRKKHIRKKEKEISNMYKIIVNLMSIYYKFLVVNCVDFCNSYLIPLTISYQSKNKTNICAFL